MPQAEESETGTKLPGAGALLLVALAGLVVLAVIIHSGEGRVAATSPTPAAYGVEWVIELPENLHPGGTGTIRAEAILTEPSFQSSPYHDPWYAISVEDPDSTVRLTSLAVVAPDSVADGATWNLQALAGGEVALTISLTYKQSYCFPCDTHYYTDSTTAVLTVVPLPGDVDCDTVTNSIDAALVLHFAAGLVGSVPCADQADVSGDGSLNALDATLILQFAAGLIDELSLP